jgi:hypothetical protein
MWCEAERCPDWWCTTVRAREPRGPASGFPIAVMHIDELREHVRDGTLGSALVYNRNSAMHGSA